MPSELRRKREAEKKARTRALLLEAAQKTFVERGYHATLISDIVNRAGVGQGTFYRHFKNKRTIFQELMEAFIEELIETFSGMTSQMPTNFEEYRQASIQGVRLLAQSVMNNRDIIILLVREAPAIDREFERWFADMSNQFAVLAQFFLEHAIAQGFARPCDPDIVSEALVGIGTHFVNQWTAGKIDPEQVDHMMVELVDFAFMGFSPRPAVQATPSAEEQESAA